MPRIRAQVFSGSSVIKNIFVMEKNESKKTGPKDRSYVNKSQKHEVTYERKTPAKKFGSGKKESK
jgi:hypothetical protein